ncbi:MAG: Hpt domain-containing protein [Candidatus Eremiobacteraeota bacterium]|nr:Hpt domain-containing protein [Candidatus Eremiobacteraeota bacterium]
MKKMAGSATALELLDRFLEESPERLEACLQALAAGDLPTIQQHLHRIRSDAGWLGAKEVQELAGQGENLAVEGRSEGMEALLQDLSGRCYEVCQELHRERTVLLGSKEL